MRRNLEARLAKLEARLPPADVPMCTTIRVFIIEADGSVSEHIDKPLSHPFPAPSGGVPSAFDRYPNHPHIAANIEAYEKALSDAS